MKKPKKQRGEYDYVVAAIRFFWFLIWAAILLPFIVLLWRAVGMNPY